MSRSDAFDVGAVEGRDAPAGLLSLLGWAVSVGASDVHVEPTRGGVALRARRDGVLEGLGDVSATRGRGLVNRLMVLAGLLTYRLDVPQEGRAALALGDGVGSEEVEVRVSVMPTNHGLRAVVRLPALGADGGASSLGLDGLGLPAGVRAGLEDFVGADGGMLVLCGPAGSGKTTTVYALLERLAAAGGLSVVSLEDPIERDLVGVSQVEVTPFGELGYERALRSLLRQDPQVLALGEVRDAATAKVAVEAALSGHRLVTTLHAGSVGGAVMRLLEMGLPAYQVAGAVRGVVALRLLRRLRASGDGPGGYAGRVAVGSYGRMSGAWRAGLVAGERGEVLESRLTEQAGYQTLRASAAERVSAGLTDAAEVARGLGRGDG